MEKIILREEFIKLGQAVKAAGFAGSGAEAKEIIIKGLIKVNGKIELQRGKKLYEGDIVEFKNNSLKIMK